MAEQSRITVKVYFRWWVPLYVCGVRLFCMTFNTLPDPEKVARVIVRGTVVTIA